jgi:endonuclease/exonuclease/phosphatase family metal-dependent hydrolase
MSTRTFTRTLAGLGLFFTFAIAACDTPSDSLGVDEAALSTLPISVAAAKADGSSFLRVVSRNVFIGTDTGPVFTLDFSDIPAVVAEANAAWGRVQATDFASRAQALADEIEMTDPHVIGLQEVVQWGILDGSFQPIGGIDFLAVFQQALADRGLDYDLAIVQGSTQGALPMGIAIVEGNPVPDQWLSFHFRDAILVRGDMVLTDTDQGNYAAEFVVGPVTIKRGWGRVAFDFKGVSHHVVNTHLEVQDLWPVQVGQAQELIDAVTADLDGVTILVGDFNSDATKEPGHPKWTPTYGMLMDAGFVDAWTERTGEYDIGYSCCQDKDLLNGASVLDERLDLVLVRGPGIGAADNPIPGAVHMELLGEEQDDRTAGGLWPSDHAGVFAGLQIPAGQIKQ